MEQFSTIDELYVEVVSDSEATEENSCSDTQTAPALVEEEFAPGNDQAENQAKFLKHMSSKLGGFGLEIASIAHSTNDVSDVVKQDVEQFSDLIAKLETWNL